MCTGTRRSIFELFTSHSGELGAHMPDANGSTTAIGRPAPCWNAAANLPLDVPLWLRVKNAEGECYKLPFPCKLTQAGWINARTGAPLRLVVQPMHWRLHYDLKPAATQGRPDC